MSLAFKLKNVLACIVRIAGYSYKSDNMISVM